MIAEEEKCACPELTPNHAPAQNFWYQGSARDILLGIAKPPRATANLAESAARMQGGQRADIIVQARAIVADGIPPIMG
jgi:hypothetical protein